MIFLNPYRFETGVLDGQFQATFFLSSSVLQMLKSSDFGSNFAQTTPWGMAGYALKNGVISSNGEIIYIADSNGNQHKSVNGGANFAVILLSSLSIGISDDAKYIARGTADGVFVSNDFGVTWTNTLAVKTNMVCVSYSGQYMLAVLNAQPYVSSNYGVSWTQFGTSKNYQSCAMSLDGKYMIGVAYNSTLSYSSDFGATWANKGISQQLYTCAISNDGQHIVMGGNTFIRVSNDGGATWADKGINLNTWFYSAISGNGQYMMVSNVNSSVVYKSNDFGATWATFGIASFYKAVVINRIL